MGKNTWVMHGQKHVGNTWAKTHGKYVGTNTWEIRGQNNMGYTWAKTHGIYMGKYTYKTRGIYMGKNTYKLHGKKHGIPPFLCTLYTHIMRGHSHGGVCPRIICVGLKGE